MTMLEYSAEEVPLTTDPGGAVRVRGTRVLFELVIGAFRRGARPEEIVQMYDTLDLADVYLVIGYYLKHRVACDDYIREGEVRGAEIRALWEARAPFPANYKEILLQRLKDAHVPPAG
jgi:uncharacterized protein (DUF433 family)